MKQTKEQLVIGLAKIRQSNSDWIKGDENYRQEFAKAFNWKDKNTYYGNGNLSHTTNPAWQEIFIEVGKLLQIKLNAERDAYIRNLQEELYQLKDKTKDI